MDYKSIFDKIKIKYFSMDRKRRAYLWAFVFMFLLLLWAFISASVITHNFNRNKLQTDQNHQEALIHGIILTETKDDKKYWEIYGENGNYDSKNGIAMLDNVIGNFYDENNEVSMSFESSKGTYNENKEQIILYEDTFIVMKDLTTLKANRLEWSGRDVPIKAKGNVRVSRNKEFIATAEEMEISPDYDKFKLKGQVVSKVYEEKK